MDSSDQKSSIPASNASDYTYTWLSNPDIAGREGALGRRRLRADDGSPDISPFYERGSPEALLAIPPERASAQAARLHNSPPVRAGRRRSDVMPFHEFEAQLEPLPLLHPFHPRPLSTHRSLFCAAGA